MAQRTEMDHYAILEVSQTASIEDIKQAYQRLIREVHPDKNHDPEDVPGSGIDIGRGSHDSIEILKAWKVLSDSKLRREYDSELNLKQLNMHIPFNEEVTLDNMVFRSEDSVYVRECRCGGQYFILKSDIENGEGENIFILDCDTCSLCIKLILR